MGEEWRHNGSCWRCGNDRGRTKESLTNALIPRSDVHNLIGDATDAADTAGRRNVVSQWRRRGRTWTTRKKHGWRWLFSDRTVLLRKSRLKSIWCWNLFATPNHLRWCFAIYFSGQRQQWKHATTSSWKKGRQHHRRSMAEGRLLWHHGFDGDIVKEALNLQDQTSEQKNFWWVKSFDRQDSSFSFSFHILFTTKFSLKENSQSTKEKFVEGVNDSSSSLLPALMTSPPTSKSYVSQHPLWFTLIWIDFYDGRSR